MKNIHILKTDKPSRYVTNYMEQNMQWQNIYITSDEEIKEGDWFIFKDDNAYLFQSIGNTDNTHIKVKSDNEFGYGDWNIDYCKKIILTTDDQLIKDGVQDINDEFLEWFVKNPSCEEVGVERVALNEYGSEISVIQYGFAKIGYKIIMAKEELKQETLEDELWGNVFAKIKQYGLNYEVLTVLKQNFNISKR